MPRVAGRYYGCYVRATVSGDFFPTIRWRVMRTFTPAVQALVGLIIVPYSRQHGMDGDRIAVDADCQRFTRRC